VTIAGNHIKLATPTHRTTAHGTITPACTDNLYRQSPARTSAWFLLAKASAWWRDSGQFSSILINAAPQNMIFSGRRFAILGKPP
jgi:hypothetical protein